MKLIQINEEQRQAIMRKLEDDYHRNDLLTPMNYREYWLFTEIWQRLTDIFDAHTKEN